VAPHDEQHPPHGVPFPDDLFDQVFF
jgi:hypothetical protein